MLVSCWSHSSFFFFIPAILTLLLCLNLNFFNANETFYNQIEPIFENHAIRVDDLEQGSPIYNQMYYQSDEYNNSNIIDIYDGNLKTVHDTIDMHQYTFIYM